MPSRHIHASASDFGVRFLQNMVNTSKCDNVMRLQVQLEHGPPPAGLWLTIATSLQLTPAQRQACIEVTPSAA